MFDAFVSIQVSKDLFRKPIYPTIYSSENIRKPKSVFSYPIPKNPEFWRTFRKKPLENIVGKGENAGNQHFLLFQQGFLPCYRIYFTF